MTCCCPGYAALGTGTHTLTASGTFSAVSGLPPYAVSTSLVAIGAALVISTSLSEANLDILGWRLLSVQSPTSSSPNCTQPIPELQCDCGRLAGQHTYRGDDAGPVRRAAKPVKHGSELQEYKQHDVALCVESSQTEAKGKMKSRQSCSGHCSLYISSHYLSAEAIPPNNRQRSRRGTETLCNCCKGSRPAELKSKR